MSKHIEVKCEKGSNPRAVIPVGECAWRGGEFSNLRTARTAAKQHVEHTGHSVCIATTESEWVTPEQVTS